MGTAPGSPRRGLAYLAQVQNKNNGSFGTNAYTGNVAVTSLGALAFCFAMGVGIPLGFFTAVHKGRWEDYFGSLLALIVVCVPGLVIGPILVMVFAVKLHWFPVALWASPWHAILPTLTLGLYFAGRVARLMHEGMLATLHSEFITTALFDPLSLPAFDPAAIDRLLGEDLPALDAAAAAQVQAHLAGLGPDGETWIGEGMRRLQPRAVGTVKCPFCAQDLAGSRGKNANTTIIIAVGAAVIAVIGAIVAIVFIH